MQKGIVLIVGDCACAIVVAKNVKEFNQKIHYSRAESTAKLAEKKQNL